MRIELLCCAAQLLLMPGLTEAERTDYVRTILNSGQTLLALLNDILDLSRVEAGKLELEKIELHLPNVARSVIKGMSVLARNKNLELKLVINPSVPEMVLGDPVRLRQVLINLINNYKRPMIKTIKNV